MYNIYLNIIIKVFIIIAKKIRFFFLSFYLNLVDGFIVLRGALGGGALI